MTDVESRQDGGGDVPELHPLAPKYNAAHHSAYVSVLRHAIEKQPTARNIALAGTYGTGKSSILGEVSRQFKDRVLEVSLLTLGVEPDDHPPAAADSNPAAGTTTNRIQKEIVKQLLYQQRPASAPESRFRRITRFQWRRESLWAVAVGVFGLVSLIAIGLDISALPNVGRALEPLPTWVRTLGIYLAIPLIIASAVLVVRLFIHGRLGVEKVSAGPATITLPPRSSSYFDEYLDEIIYFFETNTACDILIIEDLDRFNDPRIFEALRALNSLLNSAKQLGGRNIRFIYAVRDSVFEKLGREDDDANDEARAELKRANRTKFFELVVPVVPFITHKNARDLMHELLTTRRHNISKDLIDLAARHVADMRLIYNIVNEYEIFEHRLLKVDNPVPELDADRLLAMILFKNAHMADFEAIRHGTSSLDKLYDAWRALVSHNLQSIRKNNETLRNRIESQQGAKERALALADRLRKTIDSLADAPGTSIADRTIYIDTKPVNDAIMATPAFWRNLRNGETQLSILVQSHYYSSHNNNHMVLSAEAVQTLIGEEIDVEPFSQSSISADQKTIERSKAYTAFLRRHTWKQLIERLEFRHTAIEGGPTLTFGGIAERLLPSRLALDLIVGGYVTPYFTLYVSSFYGQLIRPDAMTYIMRCVDHGVADPDYPLDAADVEAIIRDQGSSVLNERSMFNVSVLDHLLAARPQEAVIVARNLAAGGETESKFVDQYLGAGMDKAGFVTQLTPFMPTIFTCLATHAALDAPEKATVIDAAIGARRTNIEYDNSERLRTFVESAYVHFPALTDGKSKTTPKQAVSFIDSIGARIASVSSLSDASCAELAKTTAYRITAENLERVSQTDNISLDRLRSIGTTAYLHTMAHIEDYSLAYADSPATPCTVEDPDAFVAILNESSEWRKSDYAFVVSNAHPDCRVGNLEDVPTGAWPSLVAGLRTPMTYRNVAAYLEWQEEVDENLAASLKAVSEIPDADGADEQQRVELALSVLNASKTLPSPDHRLSLVRSLETGELPTASIDPESGDLIGNLIDVGLIADDADAFSPRLMVDWSTLEHAIRKSGQYAELLSPDTLASQHIAPLLLSESISNDLRRRVVNILRTFPNAPRDAYEAVAQVVFQGRITLDATGIELVHQGGVATSTVVKLVADAVDRLALEDLQDLLRKLGKPYSRIADKGRYVTKLANTPEHQAILKSLHQGGIVSKFPIDTDARIKVTLKQA
ncbi:hypothetical protein AB4089_15070 [Arthrobacter sp. 2MCAF15]|uniref:YobI family P-loop NTPase n=1 Tax=Arthrobacter sp. 2MCAF15 TaxID=3232984 RepID=UPI003F8FF6C8